MNGISFEISLGRLVVVFGLSLPYATLNGAKQQLNEVNWKLMQHVKLA